MVGIVVWWYFQRAELKLNHVYRTYKIFMQSSLKKKKERDRDSKKKLENIIIVYKQPTLHDALDQVKNPSQYRTENGWNHPTEGFLYLKTIILEEVL